MTDTTLRRRGKPEPASAVTDTSETKSPFSRHAQNEEKRRSEQGGQQKSSRALSFVGRVLLFLGIPFMMGIFGVLTAYLTKRGANPEDGETREIDFDKDFVFPFMLSLVMIVVIGIQTRGFKQKETNPLLAWPKVRRKRKIIHKRVIIEDDDGSDGEENCGEVISEGDTKTSKKKKGATKED